MQATYLLTLMESQMNAKTNALMNFASTNVTVADVIAKLFALTPVKPADFRLSASAPDDVVVEGSGQYSLEAPVVVALLDTAYAEIVSAATATERRDAVPVNDRSRSLSGYEDTYDGADDEEETEQSLEEQLQAAIDRAAIIARYAQHIASIKDGGASWITGFDADKYIATDPKDEEAKGICLRNGDVSQLIVDGRVSRVTERVKNRLMSFNDWCDEGRRQEWASVEWKAKLASARIQNIEIEECPVNTAIEYIAEIVAKSAFNRSTTRLEDAITRVANSRYIRLAYALADGVRAPIQRAVKTSWTALPYSTLLQSDIAAVKASDEWADHQLAQDVAQAKKDAEQEMRNAIRAQTMFSIEKQAKEIAGIKAQAAGIYALIAKEKKELVKVDKITNPKAKAKKEAKAAVTKAKTTGIAGTSKMPTLSHR